MTKSRIQDGNVIKAEFGVCTDADKAPHPAPENDRAAFIEELYRKNFADLCRVLRRLYGDGPPEPEEIAQQAFEKITSLRSTDHIENPRAFLFRVAINFGHRSIRRVQLSRRYLAEQLAIPDAGVEEFDPERLYVGKQAIRALDAAMASLTKKQREIVVRTRFYGETYAQIAKVKGWSEAGISRQLNAALKALAEAIEPDKDQDN